MSRAIRAEYEKQLLFPPCVEDWVAADHPARFLREFVDSLDLEVLGFAVESEEGEPGRPHYASDLLLKVWLYGYVHKIRSSRGLETACREHLSLIWLTGAHEPDHNTLWRFFRAHREPLRGVFREVVRLAARAGLVGLVLHAVDGTKIRSRSSTRSLRRKEELERLLAAIETSLDEFEEAVEAAQEQEEGEYRLPESLEDRQALRQRVVELLDQMESEDRKSVNAAEPEARVMKCEGSLVLSYNAQAAVDSVSGLIVGQDVVTAASDNHQLVPLLDQVHDTLGAVAERTVADGGYCSGKTLSDAQTRGYGVLVNLPPSMRPNPDKPFASNQFSYDSERDCCICPRGEELPLARVREKPGRGYAVHEYRCQSFRECPVRSQCSRDKQGRRIEISPHDAALRQHQIDSQNPEARKDLARRGQIAEAPFGWIKQAMGFRRFTQWGLPANRTQWALVCTAINLKKLLPYWNEGFLSFA